MAISPLAGKPAPEELLVDPARTRARVLRAPARRARPQPVGQLRHQRPPRLAARRHASPKPTSWRSPRRSASTGAAEARTARFTWARTRTPLSGPAQRTALEVSGRRTASRRSSSATTASRRRPSSRAPFSSTTAGARSTWPTASSITPSHNPARGRRLQVQPAQRRPGGHRRHRMGPGPRQRTAARRQCAASSAFLSTAAIKAGTTHQEDLSLPYVSDLRNVVDMEAIRGAGLKLGVDPLGGAAVRYWEPINEHLRPGHRTW